MNFLALFYDKHTRVCCISKITDKRNHVLDEGFMYLGGELKFLLCLLVRHNLPVWFVRKWKHRWVSAAVLILRAQGI